MRWGSGEVGEGEMWGISHGFDARLGKVENGESFSHARLNRAKTERAIRFPTNYELVPCAFDARLRRMREGENYESIPQIFWHGSAR